MKFAFVYWIGDPEPTCWQVISTTAINLKEGQLLQEGETYNAKWKANKETSPATVIKLGGKTIIIVAYFNFVPGFCNALSWCTS